MEQHERWVIDHGLLSGGYAYHLSEALAAQGPVRLIARPLRAGEETPPAGVIYDPMFYRLGETFLRSRSPLVRRLGRALKGVEHIWGLLALVRKARRLKPVGIDISQMVLPNLDIWAVRQLRKVAPVAVTVHNSVPLHGLRAPLVRDEHFHAVYRAADAVLTHTEHTRRAIVSWGVAEDRIHMISHPALALRSSGAALGQGTAGDFTVLLWGALKPYKGADVLVEAVARARARLPNLRCRIVGKAFYDTGELQARVADLGLQDQVVLDLQFKTDSDLDAELRGCDLVAFPYREIDTSGAFPTSLQYGKAFILSHVGGFREIELPPDVAALALPPPGDADALAESLVALGQDRDAYAANVAAFDAVRRRAADWSNVALTIETLFQALAKARSSSEIR